MNFYPKKLELIKGDASFREFYRKKSKKNSTIIVYSKKEKKKIYWFMMRLINF